MAEVTKGSPTTEETGEASEAQIAVHWREEESYPPPATFKDQANASDEAILERFSPERIARRCHARIAISAWSTSS